MDQRHSNEELREVLGALETITASGAPRLDPNVRERLIRALVRRNAALPGLARQAIRLAVALQTISAKDFGDDWLITLHGPLALLRTSRFRTYFEKSSSPNIIATADCNVYELKGPGLNAVDGQPFSLDLKRAPTLGGYLDLVCWMFGFEEVKRLVTRAMAEGDAEAPAKELHSAVSAWLDKVLPREHLERQSAVVRGFLERYPEKVNGHPIKSGLDVDDEVIFSFWEDVAPKPDIVDGFRSWQSAVRLVVAYRAALNEAAASIALYGEGRELTEDTDVTAPGFGVWVSPLAELAEAEGTPPAVKWFSSKDGRNLVETFLTDRSPPEEEGKGDELPGNAFADKRPDTMLVRTWLRYIAFGPRQRSRAIGGDAQTEGFEKTLLQLNGVIGDLDSACHAAVWILLNEAPAVGLARLARTVPEIVTEAFAEVHGIDRDRVRTILDEFSAIEEDNPDSFRRVLAELASTSNAAPDKRREMFRALGQSEAIDCDTRKDIAARLIKVIQDDREAARVVLMAHAAFAEADDWHSFADGDNSTRQAAEILVNDQTGIPAITESRNAYAQINRAGFRKQDRGSDAVIEELRLGTIHVPEILMESRHMERACRGIDLPAAFATDVLRFEAMFDRLYAQS
jgi:hypothetical protein